MPIVPSQCCGPDSFRRFENPRSRGCRPCCCGWGCSMDCDEDPCCRFLGSGSSLVEAGAASISTGFAALCGDDVLRPKSSASPDEGTPPRAQSDHTHMQCRYAVGNRVYVARTQVVGWGAPRAARWGWGWGVRRGAPPDRRQAGWLCCLPPKVENWESPSKNARKDELLVSRSDDMTSSATVDESRCSCTLSVVFIVSRCRLIPSAMAWA